MVQEVKINVLVEQGKEMIHELQKDEKELGLNFITNSHADFRKVWGFIDNLTNYFIEILKIESILDLYDNWKDIETKNAIVLLSREGILNYFEPFEGLDEAFVYDQMINIHQPKSNTITRKEDRQGLIRFIESVNLKLLGDIPEKSKAFTLDNNIGEFYLNGTLLHRFGPSTNSFKLIRILCDRENERIEFKNLNELMEKKYLYPQDYISYFNGLKRDLPANVKSYIKNVGNGFMLTDKP